MMIPGDELQLSESDLLQVIGRTQVLLELEQRKRLALTQAFNKLKAELDSREPTSSKKNSS